MKNVQNVNGNVDTCVICGAVIPEGGHVFPVCANKIKALAPEEHAEAHGGQGVNVIYTAEDVKQARRIGYRNGLKRGADQHARYAFASMALALHEMGYPKNRILRMITNAKEVAERYSTANGHDLLLDAEEKTGIEFIIR